MKPKVNGSQPTLEDPVQVGVQEEVGKGCCALYARQINSRAACLNGIIVGPNVASATTLASHTARAPYLHQILVEAIGPCLTVAFNLQGSASPH